MQRLDEILLDANIRPNRQRKLVYGVSAKPIRVKNKFVQLQICRSLCVEDGLRILQKPNRKERELDFVMPHGVTNLECGQPKCSVI